LENQLFLKRLRAAQPHLNAEELGETIILIPPDIEEQRGILIFIETKSYQIDRLISRTEKQIELLKEYRITLISEVVTGKIDVRDEVIP
jgi:type I restriction enzyme S subunit